MWHRTIRIGYIEITTHGPATLPWLLNTRGREGARKNGRNGERETGVGGSFADRIERRKRLSLIRISKLADSCITFYVHLSPLRTVILPHLSQTLL